MRWPLQGVPLCGGRLVRDAGPSSFPCRRGRRGGRRCRGAGFHLALISKPLCAYEDPDWQYVEGLADGVPLGVGVDVPRTPAVVEEKGRWRLAEGPDPGSDVTGYFKSVEPKARLGKGQHGPAEGRQAKASAGPPKAGARRRPAGLRRTDPW